MVHVVTVADHRFLRDAGHLKRSLFSSNARARLTIYCDDQNAFAPLADDRCTLVELPEMATFSAKRTKLTAFRHAIDSGSFVYLDADAIVLEPLDDLSMYERVSGCIDDLSHCPYIEDKQHPWPNAPELRKEIYINSGILYAPASRKPFFEELYRQSLIDTVWQKYIFQDRLYDNHFFCAMLNLLHEPVRPLDEQVYGWQGFYFHQQVQVKRQGEHLVNKTNGKLLRVVLFAGVRQSYDFILTLPTDVASLLLDRIMSAADDPDQALAAYITAANARLANVEDPHSMVVLQGTLAEMRHLLKHAGESWRGSRSYYDNPEAMRAFACAEPASQTEWNGLQCGGAYLEGDEYRAIRDIVRELGIQTVLETGAGESSILFSRLGVKAVSVESQEGPWLDRARAHGCTALHVPYDEERAEFAEDELCSKLQEIGLHNVDLLFIDSPVGTSRRRNLLSQFMNLVTPRYVMYHDAVRDAENIYLDQNKFSLRPVRFLDSVRGLILLENPGTTLTSSPQPTTDVRVDATGVSITAHNRATQVLHPGQKAEFRIRIENGGPSRLSSYFDLPVYASYHWLDQNGKTVVFDGIRTALPFDLDPGDNCSCLVDVEAPDQPGNYTLQISLVQEQLCWFHNVSPGALATMPVEIRSGDN